MYRNLILALSAMLLPVVACAQGCNERIGELMNGSRWFELEREMRNVAVRDSLDPMLCGMAESLTDHYFNRPDSACVSLGRLLEDYGLEMGDNNKLSMVVLLGMNMARAGHYGVAADYLQSLADHLAANGVDSTETAGYYTLVNQYREFAAVGNILKPLHKAGEYCVPMTIDDDMHKAAKNGRDAHFAAISGSINGFAGNFVFDTGAGVNVISGRDAKKYGLRRLNCTIDMLGVGGLQKGVYAIADTLRLGGMVWQNVPFLVVDIATGDAVADSIGAMLEPVIGLPVMLSMGEVQMDFKNKEFVVPAKPSVNPLGHCNMMRTDSEGLCVRIADEGGGPLYMHFDTGGYYTSMFGTWYDKHSAAVEAAGTPDSIRTAGVGGVSVTLGYRVPRMKFMFGNEWVELDSVQVSTGIDKRTGKKETAGFSAGSSQDGVIGLDMLECFDRVIINFKDMFMVGIAPRKEEL